MGLTKHRVIFDTTDTTTSDNIGSYLRSSDGTLLTHTDVGGKKSLDVNVTNTITTSNSANYAEDSVAGDGDDGTFTLSVRADTPASTAGTDGDYAAFLTDANGRLYTNIHDGGNSITVDATDLDIRDLTHVSDSVKVGDGTDFLAIAADGSIAVTDNGGSLTVDGTVAVTQSTSPWVVGDGGGSLTVDATDLDIRDLTHASDSVKVGDGTDFWAIDTTGYGRVADYYTSSANAAVSIDTTAGGTALVGSALANRTELYVQNAGNKDIYIGTGTVTAANGLILNPGAIFNARVGAALSLKAISASGTQNVRTLEFA